MIPNTPTGRMLAEALTNILGAQARVHGATLKFEELSEDKKVRLEGVVDMTWLAEVALSYMPGYYLKGAPHGNPGECPTYYDGCNCTVDALVELNKPDDSHVKLMQAKNLFVKISEIVGVGDRLFLLAKQGSEL